VVFVDNGRVVAIGDHTELMEQERYVEVVQR
jgi:ABC-type multidrug transport system fused ATPase/permease subunit